MNRNESFMQLLPRVIVRYYLYFVAQSGSEFAFLYSRAAFINKLRKPNIELDTVQISTNAYKNQ